MSELLSQIDADLNGMDTKAYVDKLNGDGGFEEDNADELDKLHGEFAEIGSPKDEEATKLRVNELVTQMEAETDPTMKLVLLTNFVLAERTTAAEVAVRLVEKRNMLLNEETK